MAEQVLTLAVSVAVLFIVLAVGGLVVLGILDLAGVGDYFAGCGPDG